MNRLIYIYPEISLKPASGLVGGLVPGIAPTSTHPAAPTPGTPHLPSGFMDGGARCQRQEQYGRGALIRRGGHLPGTLVAV